MRGLPLRPVVEREGTFIPAVQRGYAADPTFKKILAAPEAHDRFTLHGELITTRNRAGDDVLCVPATLHGKRRLTEIVIDLAHSMLGHFGPQKTADYIRRFYWW
ncbi:hypothetical protein FA95DRAFT_1496635, partial [Auriscalpium vulgare]